VFDRDYRKVAALHVDSGWVPHDVRVEDMEAAIRTICEPIFDKPLKDISFGVVLLRLFEALRRFDARIQPQLILLQKTLFNIEGLGRQLYPELDIWKTASPILREWMRDKHHPVKVAKRMWAQLPELLRALEAAPTALRMELVARAQPKPLANDPRAVVAAAAPDNQARGAAGNLIAGAILVLAATIWIAAVVDPAWVGWALGVVGIGLMLRRPRIG
jgi:ubiquinone biosynthesis protein